LGNNTKIQIPSVVVKWVTYALVLHIVALVLAAISAVFGLLAHVREMSMACCSTCVSGFAAAVALLAFIFDLTLFFLTKSRINSAGGQATTGNAIWLTLAAWILLFFSGFFYCFGRCCISNRPRGLKNKKIDRDYEPGNGDDTEHLRLDAVKAEADRKNRQKMSTETGLPAFQEYQPLNNKTPAVDFYEDGDRMDDVGQLAGVGPGTTAYAAHGADGHYAGGYAQAPVGTRAVDEYYTPARQPSNSQYPPQRQDSSHIVSPSDHTAYSTTPPPIPIPQVQPSYVAIGNQYGHIANGSNCGYIPGLHRS
jgi:SUR7/PalI family